MKKLLLLAAIALCAAAAPAFAQPQSSPTLGQCLAYHGRDFSDCMGWKPPQPAPRAAEARSAQPFLDCHQGQCERVSMALDPMQVEHMDGAQFRRLTDDILAHPDQFSVEEQLLLLLEDCRRKPGADLICARAGADAVVEQTLLPTLTTGQFGRILANADTYPQVFPPAAVRALLIEGCHRQPQPDPRCAQFGITAR
jgi:hypothetical protein